MSSSNSLWRIARFLLHIKNDIDAIDFVDLFLQDDSASRLEELDELYVLVNFRPAVTNRNWRLDAGVEASSPALGTAVLIWTLSGAFRTGPNGLPRASEPPLGIGGDPHRSAGAWAS
jgi:hypothetical protein